MKGSSKKSVLLPTIKLKSGSYILLSALNDKWIFRAEDISKKRRHKDVFGNSLQGVKGTGSVKCRPKDDSCLDLDLRLTEFPITNIGSDRFILLSKRGSQRIDSWKFVAKKLDDSSARKNRPHEPSGHNIGEVEGEKIVGIEPQKTFGVDEFK